MFHAAHEALAYCLHASLAANIKCSFVEDFRTGVLVISTIDDSSIFVRAIQAVSYTHLTLPTKA